MGKKMMVWFVLSLVMMMVSMLANSSPPPSPSPAKGISCEFAVAQILECRAYLNGSSLRAPTNGCCFGVHILSKEANTTELRRNLCECLKKAALLYHLDPAKARQLPYYCRLNNFVPIDPNADCSKITI